VDARLGKNCPGRNARFTGKERMNAAKNHVIRLRSSEKSLSFDKLKKTEEVRGMRVDV